MHGRSLERPAERPHARRTLDRPRAEPCPDRLSLDRLRRTGRLRHGRRLAASGRGLYEAELPRSRLAHRVHIRPDIGEGGGEPAGAPSSSRDRRELNSDPDASLPSLSTVEASSTKTGKLFISSIAMKANKILTGRIVMTTRTMCGALAAFLIGSSGFATAALADSMTMWVRASGTNAAAHLVELWNSTHGDKIELTTIPDNQMVTKLATGVQAGEGPPLVAVGPLFMCAFL